MSTEAKIEQVNRDIEALVINRAKLEQSLAEEQKPELRHGDYGYNCDGNPRIFLGGKTYYYEGEVIGCAGDKLVTLLGNIFDDLKAMQENVTEIRQDCCDGLDRLELDYSSDKGRVWFALGDGRCYMEKSDFPAFEKKVRKFGATLKRNEAKK